MVLSILDGFGAESAGMQVGDLIVEINGIQIKNALDMQQIALSPGHDTATVTVSEISFAAASRALRLNVPQMAHELDFLPLLNFKASSSVTSKRSEYE